MNRTLAAVALALAILFPLSASAGSAVAADPAGTTVTILDTACTSDAAKAQLPRLNGILASGGQGPVLDSELGAAVVVFEGKPYGACWALLSNGVVAVMDDAGMPNSLFPVPHAAFRPTPGI